MTIEERKNAILAKIAEIKQSGTDEEKQDMKAVLNVLEAVDK
jgi:hypothetical protein